MKKQVELVRQFGADLKEVQRIFDQSRDDPVIAKNAPPFAGSVAWVRGLVQRIKQPMEKLEGLSKLVMETDERHGKPDFALEEVRAKQDLASRQAAWLEAIQPAKQAWEDKAADWQLEHQLAPGVRDWKRLSEEERNLMIDLGYVDPEEFADESDGD